MADKTPAQLKEEEAARKKAADEQAKRDAEERQKNTQKPGDKATGEQRGGSTVPGAVSTYSGSAPISPEPVKLEDHVFTRDEVKNLAGDIARGELARVELDEEGTPTGPAFRGLPKKDQVVAPVYGTPTVQFDELVTPSGAPITKHMNPEPVLWDAGMLARNPVPEQTERQKKYAPVGGGVVNTPVAV